MTFLFFKTHARLLLYISFTLLFSWYGGYMEMVAYMDVVDISDSKGDDSFIIQI